MNELIDLQPWKNKITVQSWNMRIKSQFAIPEKLILIGQKRRHVRNAVSEIALDWEFYIVTSSN